MGDVVMGDVAMVLESTWDIVPGEGSPCSAGIRVGAWCFRAGSGVGLLEVLYGVGADGEGGRCLGEFAGPDGLLAALERGF